MEVTAWAGLAGAVFLGEALGEIKVIAAFFVIFGVYLVTKGYKRFQKQTDVKAAMDP